MSDDGNFTNISLSLSLSRGCTDGKSNHYCEGILHWVNCLVINMKQCPPAALVAYSTPIFFLF